MISCASTSSQNCLYDKSQILQSFLHGGRNYMYTIYTHFLIPNNYCLVWTLIYRPIKSLFKLDQILGKIRLIKDNNRPPILWSKLNVNFYIHITLLISHLVNIKQLIIECNYKGWKCRRENVIKSIPLINHISYHYSSQAFW